MRKLSTTVQAEPLLLSQDRAAIAKLHELQHSGDPAAKPEWGGSIIEWAAREITVLRSVTTKYQRVEQVIALGQAVLKGEGDGTYSEAEDAIRLLIRALSPA